MNDQPTQPPQPAVVAYRAYATGRSIDIAGAVAVDADTLFVPRSAVSAVSAGGDTATLGGGAERHVVEIVAEDAGGFTLRLA